MRYCKNGDEALHWMQSGSQQLCYESIVPTLGLVGSFLLPFGEFSEATKNPVAIGVLVKIALTRQYLRHKI